MFASSAAPSPAAASSASPRPTTRCSSPPRISTDATSCGQCSTKFDYVPIAQPLLAIAPRPLCRRSRRRHRRPQRGGSRRSRRSGRAHHHAGTAGHRRRGGARRECPARARGNARQHRRSRGDGDAGLREGPRNRRQDRDRDHPLAPPERAADRDPRRARRLARRPRHVALHGADAASDAHDHRRPAALSGIRSPRRGAGCRRRVRPEDVARTGIRGAGLDRAAPARERRLDRGPAREPDRELPFPRHD